MSQKKPHVMRVYPHPNDPGLTAAVQRLFGFAFAAYAIERAKQVGEPVTRNMDCVAVEESSVYEAFMSMQWSAED